MYNQTKQMNEEIAAHQNLYKWTPEGSDEVSKINCSVFEEYSTLIPI